MSHGRQGRASRRGKGAEPEKGSAHQDPEKKGKTSMEPHKTLKDRLPREEGVASDRIIQGKLKEAGGNQKKEKGEPIFRHEVGPPNEFAGPLGERHPDDARTDRRQKTGEDRKRRRGKPFPSFPLFFFCRKKKKNQL